MSGSFNVFVGHDSVFHEQHQLLRNVNNTAIGTDSLRTITAGDNNIAVGYGGGTVILVIIILL